MEGLDVVRALVRWVHAVAAVAWVGGSLFYLVVLRPSLVKAGVADRALEAAINKGFRDVVDLSIIGVIFSGAYMTFDRLSATPASTPYLVVLGLKLGTVIVMLFMARDLGTRLGRFLRGARTTPAAPVERSIADAPPTSTFLRRWLSPSRMVLSLGLVAFFLSMLLVLLFENAVREF